MEVRQVITSGLEHATVRPVGAAQATRGAWRSYAAMALGSVLYVFAIWYQVYADTRDDAAGCPDPLLQSHRQWRLRTTYLFLVWSILAGFSIPFGFGILVFIPVWVWYVYRVLKGMLLFMRRRVI